MCAIKTGRSIRLVPETVWCTVYERLYLAIREAENFGEDAYYIKIGVDVFRARISTAKEKLPTSIRFYLGADCVAILVRDDTIRIPSTVKFEFPAADLLAL